MEHAAEGRWALFSLEVLPWERPNYLHFKDTVQHAVFPEFKGLRLELCSHPWNIFCPQFITNIFHFSISKGMIDAQRTGCGWRSALHQGKCQSECSNRPKCCGKEEKTLWRVAQEVVRIRQESCKKSSRRVGKQRPTNRSRSTRWRVVGRICRWCTILSSCSSLLRSPSEIAVHCILYLIFYFRGTKHARK